MNTLLEQLKIKRQEGLWASGGRGYLLLPTNQLGTFSKQQKLLMLPSEEKGGPE